MTLAFFAREVEMALSSLQTLLGEHSRADASEVKGAREQLRADGIPSDEQPEVCVSLWGRWEA